MKYLFLINRFDFAFNSTQLITVIKKNTGKCSEIECLMVCVSSDDINGLCQWLQEKDITATSLI